MSVPVLGLQESKFDIGLLRESKQAISAGVAIGDAISSGGTTFITTKADQVAVIDSIHIRIATPAVAATTILFTITPNAASSPLRFAFRTGGTSQPRNQDIVLRPRGHLVIKPSQTLTMTATALTFPQATVRYRLMSLSAAIAAGYFKRQPFACGINTFSSTTETLFAAAGLSATQGLEVRGFAITGTQPSAAFGSPGSVLLEFTNGALTHRKFAKNCYATAGIENENPMIVGHCLIRGPLGYGIRATAETGTGAAIAIWGYIYEEAASTFPGTGIVPGATDAFDAGKYFWIYTESTTVPTFAEIFPSTTVSRSESSAVIDGYAMSATCSEDTGGALSISSVTAGKSLSGSYPLVGGVSATVPNIPGSMTAVVDDAHMPIRIADRVAIATMTDGSFTSVGATVWGRIGGGRRTASHLTNFYKVGS